MNMTDRRLLIVYAALTACALLFFVMPSLALLFGLFTLGAAFFIPSIWLYATAAAPGVLLHRLGLGPLPSVILGISPVLALALVPAMIAAPRADAVIAQRTSGDFERALPFRPPALEFLLTPAWSRDGDDPIKQAVCDEICQRLLITGQVQAVSAVAPLGKSRYIAVTYSLARMQRCPVAFDRSTRVLPSVTAAKIDGLCIVADRNARLAEALTIRHDSVLRDSPSSFSLVSIKNLDRVEVWRKQEGAWDPLFRKTEITVGRATAPFMIFPYAGFLTTVSGTAVSKTEQTINAGAYASMFEALGFSLIAETEMSTPDAPLTVLIRRSERRLKADNAMVHAILAQPGDEPFEEDLQFVANDWSGPYWSGRAVPDEAAIELLEGLILDRRTKQYGKVYAARPELVAQLADAMLTRLNWPAETPTDRQDSGFAILLAKQDDTFLAANSDKLLDTMGNNLTRNTSPLLTAAARLGRVGLPFVLAGLSSDDAQIRRDAARAACAARTDIATELSQAVRGMLGKHQDLDGALILALASLQGVGAAQEAIAPLPANRQGHLTRMLDRAVADDGSIIC